MRISELSTAEKHPRPHPSSPLLSQLSSLVSQLEALPSLSSLSPSLSSSFRHLLSLLSPLSPPPSPSSLLLFKLSYRLWNSCVDLSNTSPLPRPNQSQQFLAIELRNLAADLLSLAKQAEGVPSPDLKCAYFYLKTGLLWHDFNRFDLALSCFDNAANAVAAIPISDISDPTERRMLLDLNLARARTAWEASDRNLSITLLNRSKKELLFGCGEHYIALAERFLVFGKAMLATTEGVREALRLMSEGMSLCEKGMSVARPGKERSGLEALRLKCLRFVAAAHLQGGEFESVIKCVRVLREAQGADQHASLPVLATKAWLGLGRYGEAEKELRGMAVNEGVPEAVWVSAVESYFEAAGSAGAETTKGVFLGLLGRCHVSAGAAVRLVHRVVGEGGGDGSQVRAKVVAELVSEERVMSLFNSEVAAKERAAMHGVLWNW